MVDLRSQLEAIQEWDKKDLTEQELGEIDRGIRDQIPEAFDHRQLSSSE